MNDPTDALVQFAARIKGTVSRHDVKRMLTAIIFVHLLPAHVKDAARATKDTIGNPDRVMRSYVCIQCGQSFESNDDTLQWIHTMCPNCVDDEKYCYYGPDESEL